MSYPSVQRIIDEQGYQDAQDFTMRNFEAALAQKIVGAQTGQGARLERYSEPEGGGGVEQFGRFFFGNGAGGTAVQLSKYGFVYATMEDNGNWNDYEMVRGDGGWKVGYLIDVRAIASNWVEFRDNIVTPVAFLTAFAVAGNVAGAALAGGGAGAGGLVGSSTLPGSVAPAATAGVGAGTSSAVTAAGVSGTTGAATAGGAGLFSQISAGVSSAIGAIKPVVGAVTTVAGLAGAGGSGGSKPATQPNQRALIAASANGSGGPAWSNPGIMQASSGFVPQGQAQGINWMMLALIGVGGVILWRVAK